MATIAVIGPGAIGGVVAAALQRTGRHTLVLCGRRAWPSLQVETPEGRVTVPGPVLTDPAAAPVADWVLVATKTYDVPAVLPWLPRLRAQGAPVAVLQNGVEHRERFAGEVPAAELIPVVVDCPAERRQPDDIWQRGVARLTVAADEAGRAFADLFAGSGAELTCTDDFVSALWRKLCINCAGILPALLLKPGIMRELTVGELARDLVRECIAVGRAEGATLPDSLVESVLEGYRAAPPTALNSLHADRLAHRPMEIDARNGVIVRRGERHGIPTPANRMAATVLAILANES